MDSISRNRRPSPWLAACLVLAWAAPAPAQDADKPDLGWKLAAGQTLRYRFHQVSDLKLTAEGQSDSRLNDLTIDLTWKVESVAEDGRATITQTLDRVKTEVKAGGQSIVYDSAEKKAEGPGAETLSQLYGAAIGAPYTLTLGRDGRIADAKVPEAVTKAIQGSPYQGQADGGSVFSADGLKRMLAQATPELPAGPRPVGATWDEGLDVPSGPLQIGLETQYKLAGVEGDEAAIAAAIQIDVRARPGAPIKVTVNSQSGEGEYRFNLRDGRLARSTVKQSFDTSFEAGGRTIGQVVAITMQFEAIAAE
jgi:hypothetical protein